MIWLMSKPARTEAVTFSKALRLCSLSRGQPIPLIAGTTQITYLAKNIATTSSKCLGAPVQPARELVRG